MFTTKFPLLSLVVFGAACTGASVYGQVKPLALPGGDWELVENMSDEFLGSALDASKWHSQDGSVPENQQPIHPFRGRDAQFNPGNIRIDPLTNAGTNAGGLGGFLKIRTQWDSGFSYANGYGTPPVTTGAIISKNTLEYGYMEIRALPANSMTTSAFWMTGDNGLVGQEARATELDVFEFTPNPPGTANDDRLDSQLWSSVHDWSLRDGGGGTEAGGGDSTWTDRTDLGFQVTDGFHVYGVEWNPDYLEFHVDGQVVPRMVNGVLKNRVTRADIGDAAWTVDVPMRIWADSEIFDFIGTPTAADLPREYQIDYIRTFRVATVPEPSSLVLTGIGLIAMLCRRRR